MSDHVGHLPLQDIGLNNIPAVPYLLTFSTVLRLGLRALETRSAKSAKDGLSVTYTIGGRTATALSFFTGERRCENTL